MDRPEQDTPGIGRNLMHVPPERQCGAKTRRGTPCRKWGIPPSGRCRNHGGRSLRGFGHPRLTHGRSSKDPLVRWLGTLEEEAEQRAARAAWAEDQVRTERAAREARERRRHARLERWSQSESGQRTLAAFLVREVEAPPPAELPMSSDEGAGDDEPPPSPGG